MEFQITHLRFSQDRNPSPYLATVPSPALSSSLAPLPFPLAPFTSSSFSLTLPPLPSSYRPSFSYTYLSLIPYQLHPIYPSVLLPLYPHHFPSFLFFLSPLSLPRHIPFSHSLFPSVPPLPSFFYPPPPPVSPVEMQIETKARRQKDSDMFPATAIGRRGRRLNHRNDSPGRWNEWHSTIDGEIKGDGRREEGKR